MLEMSWTRMLYNILPHGDVENLWIFHSSRYTYIIFSQQQTVKEAHDGMHRDYWMRWGKIMDWRMLNIFYIHAELNLYLCNTSYKLTIFLSFFLWCITSREIRAKNATLTLISILQPNYFFPHCKNTQKWYFKLRFCFFYRCCSSSSTSHFPFSLQRSKDV